MACTNHHKPLTAVRNLKNFDWSLDSHAHLFELHHVVLKTNTSLKNVARSGWQCWFPKFPSRNRCAFLITVSDSMRSKAFHEPLLLQLFVTYGDKYIAIAWFYTFDGWKRWLNQYSIMNSLIYSFGTSRDVQAKTRVEFQFWLVQCQKTPQTRLLLLG